MRLLIFLLGASALVPMWYGWPWDLLSLIPALLCAWLVYQEIEYRQSREYRNFHRPVKDKMPPDWLGWALRRRGR